MEKQKIRLLALSLASLTAIASLIAYFTSNDVTTNTFGSTTLQIRVTEPHWKNNPTIVPEQKIDKDPYIVNTDQTPAYVFMQVTVPVQEVTLEQNSNDGDKGKKLTSVSTVTDADGNSSDVVNLTHTVPLFRFITSADTYTDTPFSSSQLYNTGWYAMPSYPIENKNNENETVSFTYLYAWTGNPNASNSQMAVLHPGETTTTPLFNQVIFCNAREDDSLAGSIQHIEIEVFGIQSEYLKSSDETETQAEKIWQYLCNKL
ncbi:MAG: hypothetical protein IJJ69_04435 [Oscillospiraceae bacterium]|nr:hypothetical protein [Oscillospiraceae bacterium]